VYEVARKTFSNESEQHVFVRADFEVSWKADCPGTDVPEQNTERVDIDAVVVLARHQLGRHVQRRANYTARHHRLRFTEPEICQSATVVCIQLQYTITIMITQLVC